MTFLVAVAFLFSLYLGVKTVCAIHVACPLLFPWITGQILIEAEWVEHELDLEFVESLTEEMLGIERALKDLKAVRGRLVDGR